MLGELLADNGMRLIYGGGRVGLMGICADAALAGGGSVIGVIPEHLHDRELAHPGLDELVVTPDMHTRKAKMFRLADACVVLPGGLGTLDEMIEMITWRQLGLHDKPIVLVNVDGYWDRFVDLVEHVIVSRFADDSARELFHVVATPAAAIAAIRGQPLPRAVEHPELL